MSTQQSVVYALCNAFIVKKIIWFLKLINFVQKLTKLFILLYREDFSASANVYSSSSILNHSFM